MNRTEQPADATARRAESFASRALFAVAATATFAVLAWADWTGLGDASPAWWLLPMAVALAVGGIDEMAGLFARRGVAVPAWLLRPAVVAVVLSAAAAAGAFASAFAAASPAATMGWPAAVIAGTTIALCGAEIAVYRPGGGSLERLAASVFSIVFVGLPLAFIVSLRLLCVENLGAEQHHRGHLGMLPLVSLVAVTKAGDVAAYAVGSLVGRNRMAPILSPGKTWEGAAAALVGSLLASWIVFERSAAHETVGPWGGWGLFGLLVGLAGMAGDLAESLLKRECGAKDSGRSLGGLGGILDLVDSLLFAAPVAWMLWVAGRG